jgi:DNA-binding NarL/FixJ family response regulator
MQIKTLIVDDHQAMREVVRALLEMRDDLTVVGEAENGQQAVAKAARSNIGLVVMDVTMPKMGGAEATRSLLKKSPNAHVIALSNYSDKRLVRDMLDAGAQAYVLKEEAFHDLSPAVDAILAGRQYLGRGVSV